VRAVLLWSVAAIPCDGAVFYQAEGPLASDFDGDGAVAFADFLLFGQQFGLASEGSTFDARFALNADGAINFADFVSFAFSFGATGDGPPATPDYALYVLDPGILDWIPEGEPFDLPDLVRRLLDEGQRVASFLYPGYWLDIGRHDDYAQAVEEFEARRAEFLPGETT